VRRAGDEQCKCCAAKDKTDDQLQHVGAGGEEVWTFKALKPGTSSLSMEYSQPWDGGTKAGQTFVLNVVAK